MRGLKPSSFQGRKRLPPKKVVRGIPAKKRHKKTSLTKAKKELEKAQKELTILLYGRDCFTCPQKNLFGANCHLGHVPWPRSYLSITCKYDHRFTRIQCFRCNVHMGGMGAVALERMKAEGIDTDELRAYDLNMKGVARGAQWFAAKIQEYETLLSTLSKE